MKNENPSKTLSRDDYAQLGLELLAQSGIGSVTVAAVCERLRVTKGSFYHHFSGAADLQDAMIEYWEDLYGQTRPASLEGLPPLERLDAAVHASIERAHAIEAAIRTWSHTDPRVAAAQRRLDDLRISFVADTLAELGVPTERARVLAEMSLSMLTGFQTRTGTIDLPLQREAAREWRHMLHLAVDEASAPTGRAARGPAV